MKRLAILTAAAALVLTPAAAAAPNPGKPAKPSETRTEKVEKVKKAKTPRSASARARCAAERRELGVRGFTAKYGKARTKGSVRAKAKAARAAFGRCVKENAKALRAEREAASEAEEEELDALEEQGALEELAEDEAAGLLDPEFVDDAPGIETPEPDDGGEVADDAPEDPHAGDEDPAAGLDGTADLD